MRHDASVRAVISRDPDVTALVLVGSHARRDATSVSDLPPSGGLSRPAQRYRCPMPPRIWMLHRETGKVFGQ